MSNFWKKLIGDKEHYGLQHRILNASMLLTVLLSLLATISNYLLGLHWIAILIALLGAVFFLFLYLLSFKAFKFKLVAILGLGLLIAVFLPLIWFSNEGTYGSSLYLVFLILTGVVTITKGVTRSILIGLLVFTTVTLYGIEYSYPELLIPYPNRTDRYLDLIIAFIIMVVGATAYINIYYNEYHTANNNLTKKNILLEKKQEEIIIQQSKIEKQKVELEKKAKDLQEANKTKDRFFSIVAHDLKNPFNALIGFSELIEQAVDNKDIEEIEKLNQIILQSSKQTHKLLLNLLEWSKAQTNQIQYNPEKIDIEKIVDEKIHFFNGQATKKGVKLIKKSTHCMVFADLNMLKTILRNLISNAIKYTTQGKIILKTEINTNKCIISIRDEGIGIPKSQFEELFSLKESKSTPGTEGEKGTGLGLILCKEFVEKNKGEIFVESTVNEGSVFSFTLPLYEDEFLN